MATATLRPNAAGDKTELTTQFPASGEHWDKVDEAVTDEDDTWVRGGANENQIDLYNLESLPGGVGAISNVALAIRARRSSASAGVSLILHIIKTGGTEYQHPGGNWSPTTSYDTLSRSWATNPQTGVAWTVDEVNALQAGVLTSNGAMTSRVTQVYIEVTYTSTFIPKVMIF